MKKVLFIPTMVLPIPDTKGGAIERLLTSLIEENEKARLSDFVVLSVYENTAYEASKNYLHTKMIYQKRKSLFLEKIFMYTYVLFRKLFHIHLPFFNPNYLSVSKIVKEEKPDVVVMEGSGGENLKILLKQMKREALYLHLHHEFLPNRTLDETYGTAIAPSGYIERKWKEATHYQNQKTEVIFHGIDEKRFKLEGFDREEERRKEGIKQGDFILLFCGRIIKEKGVLEIIAAFKKANLKNAKLLLIGSAAFGTKTMTPYEEEVKRAIEGDESIIKKGFINNEEMPKYYHMADLLAVPSLVEEAAGMVAVEAMASGLPILATDTGGLPEYVGDAAVIVKKEGKSNEELSEALAERLKELYKNSFLRKKMGLAGRKNAKKYTNTLYYQSFMEVIKIGEAR